MRKQIVLRVLFSLSFCLSFPHQGFAGFEWCTPASSDGWQMRDLVEISEQNLDSNECGRRVVEWIRRNHLVWPRVYRKGLAHIGLTELRAGDHPLKINRTWRAQIPLRPLGNIPVIREIPILGGTTVTRILKAYHDCIILELDYGKWGAIQKSCDGKVECPVLNSSREAIEKARIAISEVSLCEIELNHLCTLQSISGRPRVRLGDLENYVKEMDRIYYDFTQHNCWHFCDRVEMFLVAAGMQYPGEEASIQSWDEIWKEIREDPLSERGLDLTSVIHIVSAVQGGSCEIQ